MDCLNECENDVLNYFIGKADAGVPLYMCADDLHGKYTTTEVQAATEVLHTLGIISNCGTSSAVLKLSASAMGGVLNGTLTAGQEHSMEVKAMIQRLLQLEAEQEAAARKALAGGTQGGLAPAEHQPGRRGKGSARQEPKE